MKIPEKAQTPDAAADIRRAAQLAVQQRARQLLTPDAAAARQQQRIDRARAWYPQLSIADALDRLNDDDIARNS
jgi:hypothetical protein